MQHGREMASFSEERKDEHDKLMMVGRSMPTTCKGRNNILATSTLHIIIGSLSNSATI
jgi:hypothetical protein